MSTNPARLKRMAVVGLVAGLASASAGVATAAQDRARSNEGSAASASRAGGASVGSPTALYGPEVVRIYRSVGADGRVTFGDQPVPGATTVQIRSFASSSDDEAMATATAQQAYWREQSRAFARRRAAREQAELRAERERFDSEPGGLYVLPYHLRPPRPQPLGGIPVTYGSSPGVASGTPAGFISSGFANSGR